MPQKSFWRSVLIAVICVSLATPARADLNSDARNIVIGIVAVTAAIAVVVTIVVIHYSKKRTITGCVDSGANGMTITDERDQRVYVLSGNTAGVTPGDRTKFQGQKVNPRAPTRRLCGRHEV